MMAMEEGSSWYVVSKLGLLADWRSNNLRKCVIYGSADPLPNPGEYLLTYLTATLLHESFRFFVYSNGQNLKTIKKSNIKNRMPSNVFQLEEWLGALRNLSVRDICAEVWKLRNEPVIVAHLDNRVFRATSKIRELTQIPDISIDSLHKGGGWLGGSGIHYVLRRKFEALNSERIWFLCPYQSKGKVYEIYRGFDGAIFLPVPFVRIIPPPEEAPQGWEPMTWQRWERLDNNTKVIIINIIRKGLQKFFSGNEAFRRLEVAWNLD
jgi:hypothetical protein